MRFRVLDYYAQLEDKIRADRSEGVSQLQVPGEVHHILVNKGKVVGVRTEKGRVEYTGEFINTIYIYCFSYPPDGDPAKLPSKFGKYVVQATIPNAWPDVGPVCDVSPGKYGSPELE